MGGFLVNPAHDYSQRPSAVCDSRMTSWGLPSSVMRAQRTGVSASCGSHRRPGRCRDGVSRAMTRDSQAARSVGGCERSGPGRSAVGWVRAGKPCGAPSRRPRLRGCRRPGPAWTPSQGECVDAEPGPRRRRRRARRPASAGGRRRQERRGSVMGTPCFMRGREIGPTPRNEYGERGSSAQERVSDEAPRKRAAAPQARCSVGQSRFSLRRCAWPGARALLPPGRPGSATGRRAAAAPAPCRWR